MNAPHPFGNPNSTSTRARGLTNMQIGTCQRSIFSNTFLPQHGNKKQMRNSQTTETGRRFEVCCCVAFTDLTETENSPGADSLSLTRNTPVSCHCRRFSASSLDTRPTNHLQKHRQFNHFTSQKICVSCHLKLYKKRNQFNRSKL